MITLIFTYDDFLYYSYTCRGQFLEGGVSKLVPRFFFWEFYTVVEFNESAQLFTFAFIVFF